jgi:hypothetical protein
MNITVLLTGGCCHGDTTEADGTSSFIQHFTLFGKVPFETELFFSKRDEHIFTIL